MDDDQLTAFDAGAAEYQRAIVARRHLPSELRHRPLLKWPSDVAAYTGISEGVLRARQAANDAPTLTYIGRQVFCRPKHLDAWLEQHDEVPA